MTTDAEIVAAFEAVEEETVLIDKHGRRYWPFDSEKEKLEIVASRLGVDLERVRSVMIDEWGSLGG